LNPFNPLLTYCTPPYVFGRDKQRQGQAVGTRYKVTGEAKQTLRDLAGSDGGADFDFTG
jgi:hypothetical protein